MARLPFGSQPPATDQPLPVSAAAEMIRGVLQRGLPARITVVGEVSNLSARTHLFFSLKDEKASLRCVCFASAARKLGFDVADGQQVIATGRVDFFEGQGSIQLYVDTMQPVGVGPLELRLRQMAEELKGLGYFEPERKKALPLLPGSVAVVTSRTGAALQDVINTAQRRWAGCRLVLVDVRVQGASAAPQIARAIHYLSAQGKAQGIDAIILTRGGGSLEDLWAFNERQVADAIYRCQLPLVAAIGHETDTTIAELVADLRCATPTQAAMQVVPDAAGLRQQLDHLTHRLTHQTQRHFERQRDRIDRIARHPYFRQPAQLWRSAHERWQRARLALPQSLSRLIANNRQQVEALAKQLQAVGPAQVLRRGYSYTLGENGQLVARMSDAPPGARLTTVVSDGRITSTVEGDAKPTPTVSPTKSRRAKPASKPRPTAPSLFE